MCIASVRRPLPWSGRSAVAAQPRCTTFRRRWAGGDCFVSKVGIEKIAVGPATSAGEDAPSAANSAAPDQIDQADAPSPAAAARRIERPQSKSEPGRGRPWSSGELGQLVHLAQENMSIMGRPGWQNLVAHFTGRTCGALAAKFRKEMPGVRCRVCPAWSTGEINLYRSLIVKQCSLQMISNTLRRHGYQSIQVLGSILRNTPFHFKERSNVGRVTRRRYKSDPLPVKHMRMWTEEDMKRLVLLRSEHMVVDWLRIGKTLGRTPAACVGKYNKLQKRGCTAPIRVPNVGEYRSITQKQKKWTKIEVQTLCKYLDEKREAASWAELSKLLPGRLACGVRKKLIALRGDCAPAASGKTVNHPAQAF